MEESSFRPVREENPALVVENKHRVGLLPPVRGFVLADQVVGVVGFDELIHRRLASDLPQLLTDLVLAGIDRELPAVEVLQTLLSLTLALNYLMSGLIINVLIFGQIRQGVVVVFHN